MKFNIKPKLINVFSPSCICGKVGNHYFNIRGFDLFKCKNCSLIFVWPRNIDFDIYNKDYFSGAAHGFGFVNYEEDKIASVGYLKLYLRWLKKMGFSKNSKLLDIGAANGFFVNLASEAGFDAKGLEVSVDAVEWAQKLGRNVMHGDAMSIPYNTKYDVITILDVLEHIKEPDEFISKLKLNLNHDGVILLNVPNAGSFFAKISRKSWHSFIPPEHLFYFNKKSLKLLLNSNSYKVISMKSISKTFKLSYVYKTIMNSPQVSTHIKKILKLLNPIFNSRIGSIKIFLPLYDNLTVVAQAIK